MGESADPAMRVDDETARWVRSVQTKYWISVVALAALLTTLRAFQGRLGVTAWGEWGVPADLAFTAVTAWMIVAMFATIFFKSTMRQLHVRRKSLRGRQP